MPKRAGYHHGDLKAALVTQALSLIAEQGVTALSVAEVARRAGVSGGAPYRHFPSRQALLAATATTAARELARQLRDAQPALTVAGEQLDAVDTSALLASVYTRFAAEHGAGLDLIFATELQGTGDQELLDAGRSVLDAFLPAVLSVTRGDAKAALELLERQIAAAHGYAVLLRTGFLQRREPTLDDVAGHTYAVARSIAGDATASHA